VFPRMKRHDKAVIVGDITNGMSGSSAIALVSRLPIDPN
jgi:hypothetical protein